MGIFVAASVEAVEAVEVESADDAAVVCVGALGFVNLFARCSKGLANWKRSCQQRVQIRCFDLLVDQG